MKKAPYKNGRFFLKKKTIYNIYIYIYIYIGGTYPRGIVGSTSDSAQLIY